MSFTSRKEYIEGARVDYSKAKKAQKTIILDHMQSVTMLADTRLGHPGFFCS